MVVYSSGATGCANNLVIKNNGDTKIRGNLDCGGGIAITGSNAFYSAGAIDTANITNTYLNLKDTAANSDCCYIRPMGGVNAYKLAFDFHDNESDARFCIRKIQSTANPDSISQVFTVDNGNVSCTGDLTIANGLSYFPKNGNPSGTLNY